MSEAISETDLERCPFCGKLSKQTPAGWLTCTNQLGSCPMSLQTFLPAFWEWVYLLHAVADEAGLVDVGLYPDVGAALLALVGHGRSRCDDS